MEKQFYNSVSAFVQHKYTKALDRFERNVQSGRFATFSQYKKQQIWNRLCRYAKQLGIALKPALSTACLAAALSLVTPVSAQTFTAQTGASNPLSAVSILGAAPTFVDIDNDSDMDAFVGANDGTISYYKNTGTSTAPVFTVQTGASNPLNVDIGYKSKPNFVDIDGDGDKDVFIGGWLTSTITYYKNTGTASAPTFTVQTGAANPLNGLPTAGGITYSPVFVDIDNDGDQDVLIGMEDGTISYYKNTGTSSTPTLTVQTGSDNPLNGVDVGNRCSPTFVDIDGDGDKDAFIGADNVPIKYYKNTGTTSAPVFTAQTGAANPLNGITLATTQIAVPTFVDIDADGDQDLFLGHYNPGEVLYYKSASPVLAVELTSFAAANQGTQNVLTWNTATEVNNKGFEVERQEGTEWKSIGFISGQGKVSSYQFIDNTPLPVSYYRLRQKDNDGQETISKIVSVVSNRTTKLRVYPTVAATHLTVDSNENDNFEIVNLFGQIVLSGYVKPVLDVSDLPQGHYIIKVGMEQAKFMKQ